MPRPPVSRKPRASSQSRIAVILAAARELLAEGKRAADEKRKAREARERDPERAR